MFPLFSYAFWFAGRQLRSVVLLQGLGVDFPAVFIVDNNAFRSVIETS